MRMTHNDLAALITEAGINMPAKPAERMPPFPPQDRGRQKETYTPAKPGHPLASGCARRSWRPGKHCASATAVATSRGSSEVPSWPRRLPELL